MKKIGLTIAALALTVLSVNAQIKEGTIIYDMRIEGLPPEAAAMMDGMETTITFKGNKSLTETTSMMFNNQVLVDDNGMLMLMDQMGNKFAVKQTNEEIKKEQEATKNKLESKIIYLDETKTIAGYECKKAIVTMTNKDHKEEQTEVWYCDKFENLNKNSKIQEQGPLKGLNGVPFEYAFNRGGMKMYMLVKQVTTGPVDDSKFKLSMDGYKQVTAEQLKAMRGEK